MKNTLLVAGFCSIIMAVVLYTLGYTNLIYEVGNGQVLVYPGTFFSLLGLVLFYMAYKNAMKTL